MIADQARVRRDLTPLRPGDEPVSELKVLTRHRRDLSDDRTRTINRLRGHLTEIFPGLERELDLGDVGPLVLLTGYQTSAAIRRTGRRRLATWLRNRKVRSADELAAKAVQAAEGQHTTVPGEDMTAHVVHSLAREVMALDEKIAETDKLIEGRFRRHRNAEVITSMPGIGVRGFYDRKRAEGKRHSQPSWRSPAAGSTFCGPSCVTDGATAPYRPSHWPLDISMRNR